MSAPAGWYPTPDGRERRWDGAAWTEEVRDPIAQPIAYLPPETSGQAIYGQQTYGQQTYGQPGQPGQPTSVPPPEAKKGKGCLIAALVAAGLAVVLIVVGGILAVRLINKVKDDPSIILPSGLPSGFPSDLPTPLDPSAPGGTANPVETTIGGEIVIGGTTIAQGWTVSAGSAPGLADLTGMTATSTAAGSLPLMINVTFLDGSTELGSTFCTIERTTTPSEASCVPVADKVKTATKVSVQAAF